MKGISVVFKKFICKLERPHCLLIVSFINIKH